MSFKLLGLLNPLDFPHLRLTFPTVAANTSVLQILPRFVEVLSQKIDKISTEKGCCLCVIFFSASAFQERLERVDTEQSKVFLGQRLNMVLCPFKAG